MSKCPHCGGELQVIIGADLVEAVARRRDHVLDAFEDYVAAQVEMITDGLEVADPAQLRPAPDD